MLEHQARPALLRTELNACGRIQP
ncbi:MAG: hypothetical protein RLZZ329_1689, partial [Pseudomonadota bacterium]